jgi:hypothetical protein
MSKDPSFFDRTIFGIDDYDYHRRKLIFGSICCTLLFGLLYLIHTYATKNPTSKDNILLVSIGLYGIANTLLYPYAAYLFHRIGKFLGNIVLWGNVSNGSNRENGSTIIFSPVYVLIELFLNMIGFMIRYFLIPSIIWSYSTFIAPFGLAYLYYINRPKKVPY